MQQFALTLSPYSGRVSVRPINAHGLVCQPLFTFASEELAQQFLTSSNAVKIQGSATINGTYQMDVPIEQKVSK